MQGISDGHSCPREIPDIIVNLLEKLDLLLVQCGLAGGGIKNGLYAVSHVGRAATVAMAIFCAFGLEIFGREPVCHALGFVALERTEALKKLLLVGFGHPPGLDSGAFQRVRDDLHQLLQRKLSPVVCAVSVRF